MRVFRCHVVQVVVVGTVAWVVIGMLTWQLTISCPRTHQSSCSHDQVHAGTIGGGEHVPVTPVYVIEEHHEALLYWFDAANKGLIKRQGNVLLHIDAHSDGAPMEERTEIPLFRWPSVRDVFNMMQRNDVFIVGAAYTGLITRYIWVWSPWDLDPGETTISSHQVKQVEIGTVSREGLDGRMFKDICMCIADSAFDEDDQQRDVESCMMPNMTHLYDDTPEVIIDRDRCRIQMNHGVIEIVSEEKAIELMRTGKWITSLDSVILDIDEDYYGCEAAVQPLYDVGLTGHKVLWLQDFVGNLFCASTTSQENEADKFYASVIDRIVHLKQFCSNSNEKVCKHVKQMSTYLLSFTDDLYGHLLERNLEKAFCGSAKSGKKDLKSMLKILVSYNIEQLKALKEVGICLMGTPRTKYFNPQLGMRICDGYNRPNDTMVSFHTPTIDEVTLRTNQLRLMLHSASLHPGVVTVCRSMRDGYTPRRFFHKIEHDILEVLTDVFPHIHSTTIFYDSHLLGGAFGWPNRH